MKFLWDWIIIILTSAEYTLTTTAALIAALSLIIYYFWQRRTIRYQLRQNHGYIYPRMLRIIATLSSQTGKRDDIWMVDLYIESKSRRYLSTKNNKLVRQILLTLKDTRFIESEFSSDDPFFGNCYRNVRPLLWWNKDEVDQYKGKDNYWDKLDSETNNRLKASCGAISIYPLVDSSKRDCYGLLAVHVDSEYETITTALGVLTHHIGISCLSEACIDIHNQLSNK